MRKYIVVKSHLSEFPNPIRLKAGDTFAVGEMYEGPEGWANWYLCSTAGQEPGWVPKQVILLQADGSGRAAMDYTAQEMNVAVGETVEGGRRLNGWVWCSSPTADREGWVPEENCAKPRYIAFSYTASHWPSCWMRSRTVHPACCSKVSAVLVPQ